MKKHLQVGLILAVATLLLSCKNKQSEKPAGLHSDPEQIASTPAESLSASGPSDRGTNESLPSSAPGWTKYASPLGYTFESPSDAEDKGLQPAEVEIHAGEIFIHILVTSRQDPDTGHIVSNEEMHTENAPQSPLGPPRKIRVGALDGLISEGADPDHKWVTVITAVSKDWLFIFETTVPESDRLSDQAIISRINSSFTVTKPITKEEYANVLAQMRVASSGLKVLAASSSGRLVNAQGGRAVCVERYPKGFALVRYSGTLARELSTPGREAEDVEVLFDGASEPIYALRPNTGETVELYKVVRKSNHDLIYAIPIGPYETRVYEGPILPMEGFPARMTNVQGAPDIDEAYLHPSAQQKARWMEEAPMLDALKLQR